jgi:hypothetical protein
MLVLLVIVSDVLGEAEVDASVDGVWPSCDDDFGSCVEVDTFGAVDGV